MITVNNLLISMFCYHTGVRVVQVVAGSKSSASSNDGYALALTDSGDVYSWGKGYNGRLGHKDNSNYNTPKLVEALVTENVIQVCSKMSCVRFCCNNLFIVYS